MDRSDLASERKPAAPTQQGGFVSWWYAVVVACTAVVVAAVVKPAAALAVIAVGATYMLVRLTAARGFRRVFWPPDIPRAQVRLIGPN